MNKYMYVLNKIITSAVFLIFLACSKQDAPSIENNEVRTQNEIERLEACSLVNLNKGVLLHYNMTLLFKCTKWSEEFPHMYKSIKAVSSSSWDHFMAPLDKEFIENIQRRDRFFENIKSLDSKNGLDDLSRVLVALNETNFFDSVNLMLSCAENRYLDDCLNRSFIPSKKSLKYLVQIVDSEADSVSKATNLIKYLNKSLIGREEQLRNEINKFKNDPLYIELRLKILDAIAVKVQKGLSEEDRVFLSKLILTGNSNGEVPWVYSWIKDSKMSREKFRDLIEYPILINPRLVSEYQGLKKAYNDNFNCNIKNNMNLNDLVSFDFKTHLEDHLNIFQKREYKNYFEYASSLLVGLKASIEVCSQLEVNNYGFSFLKMMNNHTQFFSEKKFYDLFKFIITYSTVKGDALGNFESNLYFFDLIASEIFGSTNELNSIIIKRTREFYPVIYDILESVPMEAYLDLGELLIKITDSQNDERVKGIADFWSFFNQTEKNFLFNFVDRHFEGDTNFVLLFDFYAQFLVDLKDVMPALKDRWASDDQAEEMSYLSIQDIVSKMAGKETLLDFKKFFGRDQILKVLEVISNGNNVNAKAREELAYLRNDLYLMRSRNEKYAFSFTYNPKLDSQYDSKPVLECMQKFSEIEFGFYQLVRKLPEACSKISQTNIAFRAFGWLSIIENSYKKSVPSTDLNHSLLSEEGILSPYMLNTFIGTTKILDNLLGAVGSIVPTKNGIKYLGESSKYYLIDKKLDKIADKNLAWLLRWTSIEPERSLIFRNLVVKDISREENFKQLNELSKNASELMMNYYNWVGSGKFAKVSKRSLGQYDPNQDCEKVINQFVAPHPCPTKDVVKLHTNSLIKYLIKTWEKEQGNSISQLLKAVKPGEGLNIPLNGNKTSKYRLTLKETMKYLYDTSDKNLKVNNSSTYFVNEKNKYSNENLTTLERVEIVIREVRFDNNYLGVSFLNGITQTDNYNKETENRKKMLATCLKIPGVRCSRPMSDDDLRMAKNALETFDSLLDVNNGRGREAKLNYGNFLKTFEQTLVASSAKDAQDVKLLPLKDDLLLKHNGRLLGHMTMMTMWSNTARIIRDRVGRTRNDFEKFIESEDFNRVNNSLLLGFELPQAGPSAERLLAKLTTIQQGEKQNIVDQTIDWASSLDYNQTRLVEDTISRLLLMASYLGTPEVVFGVSSNNSKFQRYKNNNIFQLFLALEKIVDYYPHFKNYFPKDAKLIDVFKPVNNALVFLTESLANSKTPEKNIAYLVLNDVFDGFNSLLFKDYIEKRIVPGTDRIYKGFDFLLAFMKSGKNVEETYDIIRSDYQVINLLHDNQASWFNSFGLNLNRIANSNKLDFTPFRDYLSYTTKASICNGGRSCSVNYHYDELNNFIKYLNVKNSENQSNLSIALKTILVEDFDQLNLMLNDLLPAIKIVKVNPPLKSH